MKEPRTFFIRTYGCQMNELDTEIVAGTLTLRGLTQIEDENSADLLIYNTCSIRDLAERKVMGKLGLLGTTSRKDALIGVMGCMANAKKEEIFQKIPYVDFILGTNNIHDLNSVLDEIFSTGKQKILTDEQFSHELNYLSAKREDTLKANISIIRGCEKFCTYCVVPYTRGPEVSRPAAHIVEECQKLVDQGYKEFTLLGQNVNSYGKDKPEWNCLFHDLLYQLDKIPGMTRIRFMTSHPVDITRELMEAIRDLKSLCEFVHFPIQAGSNRILKKMHRIYTLEQYLEKVEMLREIVPGVALGTDIIVGFPTETDEEFQETFDIIEKIEYQLGYFYTYSPRKGTPAMRWKDDIQDEVKQDRLQRLLKLQAGITARKRQQMFGEVVEVLVDGRGSGENQLKGRSRTFEKVIFEGSADLIGTLQNVKVHGYSHETLLGSLTDSD